MRKYIASILLIASFVTVPYLMSLTHPRTVLALTSYFSDEFDGSSIDANKWNLSIATSGVRYAAPNTDITIPGSWILPSDPAAYGSLNLNSGLMTFTHNAGHVVPYVWRGPPSYPSPFPNSGDFSFEARIKYDVLNGQGDGLQIRNWGDSEPVGDNNPFLVPFGSGVNFIIWGDLGGLRYEIHTASFNQAYFLTSGQNDFHTYRLDYIDGIYTSYIDGIQIEPFIQSALRPDTIWFGNPVYTSGTNWSSFTIDYIRVLANGAPFANAGIDQTVVVNNPVMLDGTGSFDPDSDSITYLWSEDSGNPEVGLLSDPNAVNPTFNPAIAGLYNFTLVVNDGIVDSPADTVVTAVQKPSQAIQNLIDLVGSFNLQQGIDNSFDAKLDNAQQALSDTSQNNDSAAINSLQAFINSVEAQRGKALTNEQADELIQKAQEIIDSLAI